MVTLPSTSTPCSVSREEPDSTWKCTSHKEYVLPGDISTLLKEIEMALATPTSNYYTTVSKSKDAYTTSAKLQLEQCRQNYFSPAGFSPLTNDGPNPSPRDCLRFVRPIPGIPEGYPRLASFLDADDNFMVYRRFGYLQTRLLLDLQERLRRLEEELEALDMYEEKENLRLLQAKQEASDSLELLARSNAPEEIEAQNNEHASDEGSRKPKAQKWTLLSGVIDIWNKYGRIPQNAQALIALDASMPGEHRFAETYISSGDQDAAPDTHYVEQIVKQIVTSLVLWYLPRQLHGKPRRGRGQRKNKKFWNARKRDPSFNPFLQYCLFGTDDACLSEPAVAQMNSTANVPFCISRRYLRSIGKEHEISEQIEDLQSTSIGDRKLEGIIRNLSFRVRGTSDTFRKDFYVFDMPDDLVDVVFGWHFMAGEFKQFFDTAFDVFSTAKSSVQRAAMDFSTKISRAYSDVKRKASTFVSRTSPPSPSPPYSLCDVFAPDFTVRPKTL